MMNNNFAENTRFHCGRLHIDIAVGIVRNTAGAALRLSPINLKVLAQLILRQGQVISRTELFDAVWPNQIVNDDVLTRCISDIRTQLYKLDGATKFIETLPKRGYRWVVETHIDDQFILAAPPTVDGQELLVVSYPSLRSITIPGLLRSLLIYSLLALLLAGVFMWAISKTMMTPSIGLAVLPSVAAKLEADVFTQTLDAALLSLLRKNSNIKLLSKAAIASRPQNPFPYFFNEFGAKWVLESRVSSYVGINRIELTLVDARSGIELRSLNFEAANKAELLVKLAHTLESELLTDQLP